MEYCKESYRIIYFFDFLKLILQRNFDGSIFHNMIRPHYIVLFLITHILFSQSPKVERIGIEHGLSQSTAMVIMQDREGFLWIGTWDGLNRYDGYSFIHYRHDPHDSTSISNNSINLLFEDRDGAIWVGTAGGGLNRFDKKTKTFQRYFRSVSSKSILQSGSVSFVGQDSAGYIWSANTAGLDKIDPRTSKIQRILWDILPSVPYSKEDVSNGLIFLYSKRLVTITQQGKILIQNLFSQATESGQFQYYSFRDKNGTIWIYSSGNGIYEYDWLTHTLVQRFTHSNDPRSISSNFVRKMFEDSHGTLWVGTEYGLNKALYNNDRTIVGFERMHSRKNDLSSLSSDEVNSIAEDRSGVIWVGTKIGLNKILPQRKQFKKIPSTKSFETFIEGGFPVALYEESDSLLWIGTTGGLYLYNRNHDSWQTFTAKKSGLTGIGIHAIHKDSQQRLWVGTRYGLNRYDSIHKIFSPVLFDQQSPFKNIYNRIYVMAEDRGVLWIGTTNGLVRYDPNDGSYRRIFFDTFNSGQGNSWILSLLAEGTTLWIGTNNQGLLNMDINDETYRRFTFKENDPHSLSNNKPMSIYKDRQGTVWVATLGGGLNKIHQERDSIWFQRYQLQEGMLNDNVYGILEDDDENLWLSTNYGISKFSIRREQFTNYTTLDGLPTLEYNQNSFHRGKSGDLYFGGINGLVRFNPREIRNNTIPPPIAVTEFSIFNERHSEKLASDEIVLSYSQNFFSFEFASLCFEVPKNNQYAYKLEGLLDEWSYIGSRRFANFTNVPPGEYVFRVKGSNNDGVWNEVGRSIKITIVPPFWATVWFRMLSISLFIGAIVGGVRYSAYRKYRRQIDELEQQKRILEERQKTRDKIARDLHDDLASTVGSAGLFIETAKRTMSDDPAQAKEYLDKTSSILNEAEEAMSDIVWSVSPKHDTLQSLSTRIRLVTTELSRANGIGCAVDVKGNVDIQLSDEIRRGMYLIFKEVLNNCLKHSHATLIEVCIGIEKECVILQVKDNGVGLSGDSSADQMGGNGMHNIRKRAEEIGALISILSVPGKGVTMKVEKQLTQLGH